MANLFKIRFNTDYPLKSKYAWRVIEVSESQWKEILTQHVVMNVASKTTTDTLSDGRVKHHITIESSESLFENEGTDGGFETVIFS
jgi:hypothetical protein